MGWYLETPGVTGKAEKLKTIYNAKEVDKDTAEDLVDDQKGAVVCVVQNPEFEAAAFCYSPQEFRRFNYPRDPRPKTWLWIEDRDAVETVSGYKADMEAAEKMEE